MPAQWQFLGVLACVGAAGCCTPFAARRADLLRQQFAQMQAEPFAPTPENKKHTPRVVVDGSTVTVTVGIDGEEHPTERTSNPGKVHFIENIFVESNSGEVIAMGEYAGAEEQAKLTFEVPKRVSEVTAFAMCNRHGLFSSGKVSVTPAANAAEAPCRLSACFPDETGVVQDSCALFHNIDAGSHWAQWKEHGSRTPHEPGFPEGLADKHIPVLKVEGTRARVTVGKEGFVHPNVVSSNREAVHYIRHIYVKANSGKVIALSSFLPEEGTTPTLEFAIPKGVSSLTPFAYCNKHGLFYGLEVPIPAESATAQATCIVNQCGPVTAAAGSEDVATHVEDL